MRRLRWIVPCALLVLLGAFTAQAQDAGVAISVRVPQFFEDVFTDELLAQFEAENPGVSVFVVAEGFGVGGSPITDIDSYLENMLEYASSADVIFVDGNLAPEATRAGMILDLTPLTSSDPSLNVGEFVPAAWQSFQWDNAVWALPVSIDVLGLSYDPQAFDDAGLAYPSLAWTMDDLASAARALTQYNADGSVSVPGIVAAGESELASLMRSLAGSGFYDASTLPENPDLSNPALEALIATWVELINQGVVAREFGNEYAEIPMRVESAAPLMALGFSINGSEQENAYLGTALPGGATILSAQGFAVSGGTQYPEQAYALAKFLTNRPEVAARSFGARPARDGLVGVQPETSDGPPIAAIFGNASPEVEAYIADAIANALPMSKLQYGWYLTGVVDDLVQNGADAVSALQQAEADILANLEIAASHGQTTTVLVATPPPPVVLAEGEVSLNFGLFSNINPLPNEDLWDQVIQEFVSADPQVGEIVFDTAAAGRGGPTAMAAEYDCFTLPYNYVPELDTSTVLNLDPYLDADPAFDRSDVVGNTLSQVQRDAMTWALPLTLQLQILNYSPERFAEAGVPEPIDGWTIDQFVDALNALKVITEDDPPLDGRTPGSTYLLMLIATYGGLPLDYRTDPVTINFTDPATVDAIRQVLNLAKEGLISYQEQQQGGLIRLAVREDSTDLTPITAESLLGFGMFLMETQGENPYRLTTYPVGTQYTPLSYDITTGYISASAENPDACYRWLSTISQHPELFSGIPARRSLLEDTSVVAALGEDRASFYRQFESTIQSPNAIIFPTAFAGASVDSFILQSWLARAFDEYVVRDGDLEAALADAQMTALAYQECVANLPPADPNADSMTRIQQYLECSQSVDPAS
jgi:ABC-type glycerol-3-phosphate transport system substrate-binding protein